MAQLNIAIAIAAQDNASGPLGNISQALGGLGDLATGAVSFALGGVLKDAFDAATGAMGDFFASALEAEKTQTGLAALIHSVNSSAIESATQLAAAQAVTTTSTVLSGDKLDKLKDQLAVATAKMDDMAKAYPKLKNPTETQTLALSDQKEKVAELTAALAAGSAVITSTSSAMQEASGAGTFNVDVVNQLAMKYRDLVGGSKEVALGIEEIAIRSGAISQDQMPKFIQTVADLAAVTGDASSAATLLARAQEDPVGAMGKLVKAGILFSDDLKAQIKLMVKHGDQAGATALIMERVATATGGQAAATMDTLSGRWSILTEHLKTAGTEMLMKLLPSLETLFDKYIAPNIPVVEAFAAAFADNLGPAMTTLTGTVEQAATAIQPFIANALTYWPQVQTAIAGVVNFVIANLPTVRDLFVQAWGWIMDHQDEIKGAFIAVGVAIAGAGIVLAIGGIVGAIAGLASGVGPLIAVVAVLGAAWAGNWGGIRDLLTAFWFNTALPVLTELWTWLQVNVPLALAYLANFWKTVLLPAIQAVWDWVNTTLLPFLATLRDWLQTNIPVALQALADFWNTVLLPAIQNVWTFLTTIWWPMMLDLWTWLSTTLTKALQGLADYWQKTLLPAITAVWNWMSTTLFPFLTSLANFISAVFQYDLEVLSAVWSGILLPAITAVWKFFNESVLPLLKTVSEYLSVTFGPSITTFGGIVQGLVDGALKNLKTIWDDINTAIGYVASALNNLADIIRSLPAPPSWWKPGSPTPFELRLRGIGAAALELSQTHLPALSQQVQLMPAPALASGGGGGSQTTINYNVTGNYAYQDERTLVQDLSLFTRLRPST